MASIQKRNNSYRITVSCGYDVRGKKIVETTTFTPDPSMSPKRAEKAAQAYAADFEQRVKNGLVLSGRKVSVKEFAERWIEDYAKQNLQPGTLKNYLTALNEQILPALGHLKLTDVKPHVLNHFYVSLLKDGARCDGKPGGYSTATIHKFHTVLSSMFQTAVEWEIIDQNPCSKVRVPRSKETSDSVKYFTPAQTAAFLAYIEQSHTWTVSGHQRVDDTGKPYFVGPYTNQKQISEQMQILFCMAIYTGMRKGELLALQWDDIDFAHNTVRVTKSVSVVDGECLIKVPKTKASNRILAIPQTLEDKLKNMQQKQAEYSASVGDFLEEENWVFIRDNGKIMGYSTPYQALRKLIKDYNLSNPDDPLPEIPFHGLRHTSATLLIAAQENVKAISARMGHAQTSTTMNIYAHALQESDQSSVKRLEEVLQAAADEKSSTVAK